MPRPTQVATLLLLTSAFDCQERTVFPPCRQGHVSFPQDTRGGTPPGQVQPDRDNEAVTIAISPGWHRESVKYGASFNEQLRPLREALDHGLLGSFARWDERHAGVYRALGRILTLDPALREGGMDVTSPVVAKLSPLFPQSASIFMQLMVTPGDHLPAPDLRLLVAWPATNPTGLLRHLEQLLAKPGSCVSAGAEPGVGVRACMLEDGGSVVFEARDRLVHVDIISGERIVHRRDQERPGFSFPRRPIAIPPARVESASRDLRRDNAGIAITIPGRMVRPVMQARTLAAYWNVIRGAPYGSPGFGERQLLAMSGHGLLGEHVFALPGRLEVEATRIALIMDESVRVVVDTVLTNQGAALLERGLAPLRLAEKGHTEGRFDVERILSAVEPLRCLYDRESPFDPVPDEMEPSNLWLGELYLQAPATTWRTMADSMRPEHRWPGYIASLLAKGLNLEDLSWDFSARGHGTVAELSAWSVEEHQRATQLLDLRAWVASNRRLRVEACILPKLLPCRVSACSAQVLMENPAFETPSSISPCWERALIGLRRLLGKMVWRSSFGVDDLEWFDYAIPLHEDLACASNDPIVGADAKAVDQALLQFVTQKGELARTRVTPRPFFGPRSEEGK